MIFSLVSILVAQAATTNFERDASLPMVYLNVAIQGGMISDPPKRTGITKFLGEMLLRGTKSRNKDQIDLALDQIGANLEVTTRSEATIFSGAVHKDQLEAFLAIFADVLTHPSFPAREIRKLRSQTISKILARQSKDNELVSDHFVSFLFKKHPYGNFASGSPAHLKAITTYDLKKHYDKLFRSARFIIIGTGDTSEARIKEWGKSLAMSRPGGTSFEPPTIPQDDGQRRLLIVDKPNRTQTQIMLGQVGLRQSDENFFAMDLANYAFGGGSFSARLMQEIRVKRGWSYGAYSYFSHTSQPHAWRIFLFPASKDTPDALKYTLTMAKTLKEEGLSQAEFQKAKTSLINSSGFKFDTPKKRAMNLLQEKLLNLPQGFYRRYGENISKVTLAQANRALAYFLDPNRFAITVVATSKDLKGKLMNAAGVKGNQTKVRNYTSTP